MAKIQRAVLSCHDKTGLVDFARILRDFGVELITTAGTMDVLRENGIESVGIAEYTGSPELLNGRVKSLHPKIHAGLLGIPDSKLHREQMEEHEYGWIDLMVVNLHPVQTLIEKPGVTLDEIIDQIDIGGSAMIRSAAKNFRYLTVAVNPERYSTIIHELRAHDGEVSFTTRYKLAYEAFYHTAQYDRVIAEYLQSATPAEE